MLSACSYCSMQGGKNAFLLCAIGGHLAVAEYLASKMEGHHFDSEDDGYTALHWAAQKGQLSMVEYLVRSCGFDVKAIDKVGSHCSLSFCILVMCCDPVPIVQCREEEMPFSCVQ